MLMNLPLNVEDMKPIVVPHQPLEVNFLDLQHLTQKFGRWNCIPFMF